MNLYLAEYYDKEGGISFAWIYAGSLAEARQKIKAHKTCDEVILLNEHSEIEPLMLGDGSQSIVIW